MIRAGNAKISTGSGSPCATAEPRAVMIAPMKPSAMNAKMPTTTTSVTTATRLDPPANAGLFATFARNAATSSFVTTEVSGA